MIFKMLKDSIIVHNNFKYIITLTYIRIKKSNKLSNKVVVNNKVSINNGRFRQKSYIILNRIIFIYCNFPIVFVLA